MDEQPPERLEARITGRVQGVGFRHFCTTHARGHGLRGWVRNEGDGSVRLVAEGPRGALGALLQKLHDGPAAARVENVSSTWGAAEGGFDGFRTRRS